jgi:LmbE family N-acetylglucosaminyl deacetylase
MSNQTLLVVLAHPDDESFSIGGTLAKYAAAGVRVVLVCATRGEAGIEGVDLESAGEIRTRELQQAAGILGINEVRFLGYRDGELSFANLEVILAQVAKLIREIEPQIVITFGPDGITGHPDHITIHKVTTQAFDQAQPAACLYYIAPSEATLEGCGMAPSSQKAGGPVAAIDVAEHLLTKVRAMQCHASQRPPFSGSPEEEVARMACHEYFTLARPHVKETSFSDLFAPVPDAHTQKGKQ